jgi:hypothetical protein
MHGPEMWWLLMMACWSIENGVQECGMFALCHVALKDFAEPCPLFHKTKAVIRVLTVRTLRLVGASLSCIRPRIPILDMFVEVMR